MSTYPVVTRLADGTETTEICETYNPGAMDAVSHAKNNPQAVEIETHRVRNGNDQPVMLWTREAVAGLWIGKDISE